MIAAIISLLVFSFFVGAIVAAVKSLKLMSRDKDIKSVILKQYGVKAIFEVSYYHHKTNTEVLPVNCYRAQKLLAMVED